MVTNMSKTCVGVEIGASELKFSEVRNGAVLKMVSEPLPDNLVKDGKVVSPESMSEIMKSVVKKNHMSGKNCAAVLPASLVYTRRVTMPLMTIDQLKLNLPYEFKDYISEDKNKYFYDYAVVSKNVSSDGVSGEMDLLIAAVLKSTVKDYIEMFRHAGLKLRSAAPEEFAYLNLIHSYEAKHSVHPLEYCLIDLGHTSTRINIFSSGGFEAVRVIEIGGKTVDEAIADTLNVDEHIAEAYKRTNFNGVLNLDICKRIYNNITTEIVRALNFYTYNNMNNHLEDAYTLGESSKIKPLCDLIESQISLKMHSIEELVPLSEGTQFLSNCAAASGIALI